MEVPSAVISLKGGRDDDEGSCGGLSNTNSELKGAEEGLGVCHEQRSDVSSSSSVYTSSLSSFEYGNRDSIRNNMIRMGDHDHNHNHNHNHNDNDNHNHHDHADMSHGSNDDAIAKMIGPIMKKRGNEISHALAERVSCIDSIKWLGHHLPEAVVAFLIEEIELEEAEGEEEELYKMGSGIGAADSQTFGNAYANSEHSSVHNLYQTTQYQLSELEDDDDDETDSGDAQSSEQFPLHYNLQSRRPLRRHSSLGHNSFAAVAYHLNPSEQPQRQPAGTTTTDASTPSYQQHHEKATRRSSLPMIIRGLDRNNNSSLYNSESFINRTASCDSFDNHSDASFGAGSIRFHRQSFARRGSQDSFSSFVMERRQLGLDDSTREQAQMYFDPFPYDSDDEMQRQEELRQHRVMKTRDSIVKLSGEALNIKELLEQGSSVSDDTTDRDNLFLTDAIPPAIPPATRHDCALLFVDISGFTKLSTTLEVEPLSKTINAYFQMIVEEVERFGGDVLKFAGDAIFCEWQATTSNPLERWDGVVSLAGSAVSQSSIEPWHGLGLEDCVLTAAACSARIVDKCSDYPVYAGGGTNGTRVATLNVHCGIGFGEVVGVHVGDRETRMEYLILGDPIEQVTDAILVASRGEAVASPESLLILMETAELDQTILDGDMDKPQVIARKSDCYFRPKGSDKVHQDWTVVLQDFAANPRERLAKRCDDWDLLALTRLRERMSMYVHPVVVNDEFAMKVYPGDRNRAQERHRSEAELRSVYTVFIMPLITARLNGDDQEDCRVLVLLNDMMSIMTRELARFKGQLRQFIVDDKGVIFIANFGLRGSTFPNMIAERAIPFSTTVQTLLKAELNTECQMGATYGKAYCGIVGGVARHEYAVLGPAVNLAARLMANPDNHGFLVDESVKEKAGARQFRALQPVKAKGYANPVPIFEPMNTPDRYWKDLTVNFVGREKERAEMLATADDIIETGGPARLVLIVGESGAGKSALCLQATKQIKEMCNNRSAPHIVLRTVCCEGDIFVPFSIARPMFLDILHFMGGIPDDVAVPKEVIDGDQIMALLDGEVTPSEVPRSLVDLVGICQDASIAPQYIEIIGRLILTRNRADIIEGPRNASHALMLSSIAQYIVKVFLQCTISFDLVILALDDILNMDEMSWKIIELLYHHSLNLMIIGTTRPVEEESLKIDKGFWNLLHEKGLETNQFSEITLLPMQQSDVEKLIAASLGRNEDEIERISRDVFNQSGGMPNLASEILENFYKKSELSGVTSKQETEEEDCNYVGNIGELILNRMDSLPSSVRTHLNLGAILGSVFDLLDVVTVFEQYRGVRDDERLKHAKSVHESLEEAVRKGILEIVKKEGEIQARYSSSDHPYSAHNRTYKFTHDVWRSNILRLTLDEWKRDMHTLIAESMETAMGEELANDYRALTRLFSHWKESGSAKKAARLALKMGRNLEAVGLTHQSLLVYRESLDMWKSMDSSIVTDSSIGGLSIQVLEKLDSSDVDLLIRLNVAIGRCYTNILEPKESIKAFQTVLNFIHRAPSSVELEDRSIIFPVFSGLFVALRFGHNEDVQYEQGLVKMFLRETKLFNDPIHHSRALAMQAEMMARHGFYELAIQCTIELRGIYDVEKHSKLITEAYGTDRSGQCIAQSALWHWQMSDIDDAHHTCDYVLKELMPKMDPQNVSNSFHMLYPLLWVMKSGGRSLDAAKVFDEYVVQNFLTLLDERGLTSDRPLHMPIMALLDMHGTHCKTDKLEEYIQWLVLDRNGLFGSELNYAMGSVGRTADSIAAEMCLLVAQHAPQRVERNFLIRKGFELARDTIKLTKSEENSIGMAIAYSQVKPIFNELETLHTQLPEERQSRRLSCRW